MLRNFFSIVIVILSWEMTWADDKITFDDHAKPIFQKRCASCHNADRQSGGLDLTNYTNMMQGGSSGPSIEPGDADGSYLYLLVTHDESPEMPPSSDKIPDPEISTLAAWIDGGALENKGSVARKRKKLVVEQAVVGTRPAKVAFPLRMSLEPYFVSQQRDLAPTMATSPWAPIVALSSAKQIVMYDTQSTELLGTLPFPEGRANDLKFSRNGSLLIAGGGRHGLVGRVFGWDVETGERLFSMGEEVDNVLSADITSDHSLVALGGPQKMLRVFQSDTESLAYEVKKHTDWITAVAFSPDGVLLASADRAGGLHLWEAETGNEYLTLGGHGGQSINGLSWRSDSNVLASAGNDGAVRLWEVENGRQVKSWNAHGKNVAAIEFTRDGQLVTTGSDRRVKLWNQDGKPVREFDRLDEIGVSIAFCDESRRVVAASLSGAVNLWNANDRKQVGVLPINPPTLADRLRSAEQEVVATDAKLTPLQSSLDELRRKAQGIQKSIQEKAQTRDGLNAELQQIGNTIATAKSAQNSNKQNLESWKQQLHNNETALPIVSEARNKATEASERLPDDETLKSIADSLIAKQNTMTDSSDSLRKRIADAASKTNGFNQQISDLKSKLDAKTQSRNELDSQIAELQAAREPLKRKQTELEEKTAKILNRLSVNRKGVARWSQEIEFNRSLTAKVEELSTASKRVDEQELALAESEARLKQTKAAHARLQNETAELAETETRIESELRELRKRKN